MRKEDFYDVFEYGDRLEPGVELKIEHSITMEYDTPDLTPFTNSDVKELESLRKISAGTEQKIFDSLKEPLSKWERQAALTKLLDRAIQYLKMPEVEHTSNQWMHDDRSDRDKISNRVYQMSVSVYEDYKYDRQTRERIPTAWYVTWDVTINTPRRGYEQMSQKYSEEYYTLKAELAELKEQLSAFEDAGGWAHKFLKLIERYAAFTDLTPAILNEFISRIEVHERDKKRAKQAVQHIGIYFSYIGKFENELTQLAEPTEEEIRQMREKIEEAQKEKSRAYHRNYSKEYRAKNLEKRREYERIKAREYRAKRKAQAAALPVS